MSENNVNGITGADVATTTGIVGATVAIGQYIINDYVITIAEAEGDYGYTMTITRGTDTQTVTLYGLTPEQYASMLGYLEQAQEADQSAGESAQAAEQSAYSAGIDASSAANARNAARSSAIGASSSASAAASARDDAVTAKTDAVTAKNAAEAAATRAETAAEEITGMTAEAETLEPGSHATASFLDGVLSLGIPAGANGADGNGIVSIVKTGTSGNVDTYTITYTNGTTSTFTVTNGVDGAVTSVAGKTGEVTLDAGDVAFDDQQAYNDGTVGAGLTNLKSDVDEIKIKATNPTSDYDLALTDKNGKAIAIFSDGEIRTKDFDSSEIGDLSILQTKEKGTLVEAINDSLAGLKAENIVFVDDLSFMDKYGHAIMMLKNGGIKTLDFDSSAYPKTAIGNGWFAYQGKEISVVKNKCKLSSIFHLDGFTPSTLQGGAIYGDYYFQFDSGREHCAIYDITTHSLTQLYTFATHDNNWHCNNANFGNEFYDEDDLFPLLYVSQENISVHNVHVLRVSGEIGSLEFTHVQTITWDDPEECETYYPNAIIDSENGIIYQTGYSINNYGRNPTTKIKVFGYPLPLLSAGDVALHTDDAINAFEIASFTALQGCVVQNGLIYMISGQYSERGIRAVNPCSGNVDSYINLDPLLIYLNANIEPESLACYDGCLVFVGSSKTMLKVEFGRESR